MPLQRAVITVPADNVPGKFTHSQLHSETHACKSRSAASMGWTGGNKRKQNATGISFQDNDVYRGKVFSDSWPSWWRGSSPRFLWHRSHREPGSHWWSKIRSVRFWFRMTNTRTTTTKKKNQEICLKNWLSTAEFLPGLVVLHWLLLQCAGLQTGWVNVLKEKQDVADSHWRHQKKCVGKNGMKLNQLIQCETTIS